MSKKKKKQKLKIKAKDEDIKGSYSNSMQVFHTEDEFILDFFLLAPPEGILNSRVVLSPGHTKRLIKTLKENLKNYEEKHGEIKESKQPQQEKEIKNSENLGFKR